MDCIVIGSTNYWDDRPSVTRLRRTCTIMSAQHSAAFRYTARWQDLSSSAKNGWSAGHIGENQFHFQQMISEMSDIVWTINPRHDDVKQILEKKNAIICRPLARCKEHSPPIWLWPRDSGLFAEHGGSGKEFLHAHLKRRSAMSPQIFRSLIRWAFKSGNRTRDHFKDDGIRWWCWLWCQQGTKRKRYLEHWVSRQGNEGYSSPGFVTGTGYAPGSWISLSPDSGDCPLKLKESHLCIVMNRSGCNFWR